MTQNTISGNGTQTTGLGSFRHGIGIFIAGSADSTGTIEPTDSNVIAGNLIGTTIQGSINTVNVRGRLRGSFPYQGSTALAQSTTGNLADGILVQDATNTSIGGTRLPVPNQPLSRDSVNVIAGNGGSGIEITGAASSGNRIYPNYVGIDLFRKAAGNGYYGVYISNGQNPTNVLVQVKVPVPGGVFGLIVNNGQNLRSNKIYANYFRDYGDQQQKLNQKYGVSSNGFLQ